MKVKYMAALAAASVFGMTALTSCGPKAADTDASGDVVAPDAMSSPDAMSPSPDAMSPAPCAAPK